MAASWRIGESIHAKLSSAYGLDARVIEPRRAGRMEHLESGSKKTPGRGPSSLSSGFFLGTPFRRMFSREIQFPFDVTSVSKVSYSFHGCPVPSLRERRAISWATKFGIFSARLRLSLRVRSRAAIADAFEAPLMGACAGSFNRLVPARHDKSSAIFARSRRRRAHQSYALHCQMQVKRRFGIVYGPDMGAFDLHPIRQAVTGGNGSRGKVVRWGERSIDRQTIGKTHCDRALPHALRAPENTAPDGRLSPYTSPANSFANSSEPAPSSPTLDKTAIVTWSPG